MTTKQRQRDASSAEPQLVGVLARYHGPDELIEACEKARDAGYKDFDAYTPFPVHGIDDAIGIKRTKLPFFVLAVGLSGCALALGMQWFMNATDTIGPFEGYKYNISAKPYFGIPANIPVTFEVTVLLSAFAAFFGMWGLNRLPRLSNPILKSEEFRRVTNDGFFLMINERDKSFRNDEVKQRLEEWGAENVEEVVDDIDKELPPIFKVIATVAVFALFIPPVLIYRAQYARNELPRMHVNPDMDRQYKYKEQVLSPEVDGKPLFGDLRAARPPIPGTIPRGEVVGEPKYQRGYTEGDDHLADTSHLMTLVSTASQDDAAADKEKADGDAADNTPEPDWVNDFPLEVSEELIERGQQRFNIYCVVCHGYSGDGDGRVADRAKTLNVLGKAAWTAPKSLHDPEVVKQPVGRIYDTISNGRGAMGPYGAQIVPEDRWAIVLYVKALQKTRNFDPQKDVPAGTKFNKVDYIGIKPDAEADNKSENSANGKSDGKSEENNEKEDSKE